MYSVNILNLNNFKLKFKKIYIQKVTNHLIHVLANTENIRFKKKYQSLKVIINNTIKVTVNGEKNYQITRQGKKDNQTYKHTHIKHTNSTYTYMYTILIKIKKTRIYPEL